MTMRPLPNFSISGDKLWQAARLLAACGLAGAAAKLLHLPEWYWALITAIVVIQSDLDHTLLAARDRVVATLVGAIVGIALIFLHERGAPELPLFFAGLAPLALVTAIRPALRLSGVTLIVVFLIPGTGDLYGRAVFRVLNILLGSLACAAVSFFLARWAKAGVSRP